MLSPSTPFSRLPHLADAYSTTIVAGNLVNLYCWSLLQSPSLALIVEGHDLIRSFIPILKLVQSLAIMSKSTTQTGLANGVTTKADSAEQLISDLDTHGTHTLPLWAQMTRLNPPEPSPRCVPHIWKYDEMKPYLLRAGDLISEKQAERRVLMLVNPARGRSLTISIWEDC
jgi:hypothetical protein